jgi:hypothetical protein
MKKSTLDRSLFFLLAFACIQIPIAALAQPASISGYEAINPKQFIADRKITVSNPSDVATQLLSGEGASDSREIVLEFPNPETAVIVHTVMSVAEDPVAKILKRIQPRPLQNKWQSVAGIRYRIEFRLRQNKWEIVWVGRQGKCQPGRGHQEWASGGCK